MRSFVVALALAMLLGTSVAGDQFVAAFRLTNAPAERRSGWVVSANENSFVFRRFSGGKVRILWSDVLAEDRLALRRQAGLESAEIVELEIEGSRILFHDSPSMDGVLVRVDDKGRHYLRRHGYIYAFDEDRVRKVEPIKVLESDVFSPEQLYDRQMRRNPPTTAGQHRALGDHLVRLGQFESARRHYKKAIALRPALATSLANDLKELDTLARDKVLSQQLKRVRRLYRLDKDYERARESVHAFAIEHPDRRRSAQRLLEEIEQYRTEELQRVFTRTKHDALRAVITNQLRQRLTLAAARSYVTGRMADDIKAHMKKRLGISDQEFAGLLEAPKTGAPHWATYHHGSWIVSSRARKGKRTARKIRGDPESWWAQYSDSETQGGWLRAYAAERLPKLFEVVSVRLKDCDRCGGRGVLRHTSITGNPSLRGGHEWKDTCPRCFRAQKFRSVSFR